MEVTSGSAPELGIGRQGIVAIVKGENQHMEHLVVRDCYIHDIWGQHRAVTRNTQVILVVAFWSIFSGIEAGIEVNLLRIQLMMY